MNSGPWVTTWSMLRRGKRLYAFADSFQASSRGNRFNYLEKNPVCKINERPQERDMIDEYGVPQEPKYEREQDDVQNEDEDRIGDGREGPVCRLKYYYK